MSEEKKWFELTEDGTGIRYIPTGEVAPDLRAVVDNLNDLTEQVNELTTFDLHRDFAEYEELIDSINENARELIKKETDYTKKGDALLKIAAHIKEENGDDIIKQKYGGNNDKTRKKYVEDELKEFRESIQELKFKKEEYNRRLGFIKRLIDMKISLIKYGED